MINITLSTPNGELLKKEIDYVVIKNDDGQFAILKNHIPVITTITAGYVKLVTGSLNEYAVLFNGLLEFSNNNVVVIAQEAELGDNYEVALEKLELVREKRKEENRKRMVSFIESEKELKKQVKTAKAGQL